MTEILAVFRSRTQAIECKDRLRACGVPAQVTATPSELKIGCGFSVKFPQAALSRARHIAAGGSSFYGLFAIVRGAGGYFYRRL